MQQKERNSSRTPKSRGSPSGRTSRWTCKDYHAITHFVKNGTLQNVCSTKRRVVVVLGEHAYTHIVRLMNSQAVAKVIGTKAFGNLQSTVVHHKSGRLDNKRDDELERGSVGRRSFNGRQLGCVFQDMTPPKSILRKSTDMQRPIQRVKFTKAILHVTLKFETKILRLDMFAQVNLISVAPTLQNLRIGLRRRQSGKSKVPAKQRGSWPKNVFKLKEQQRATFFSPLDNRCLPASTLKPEERELVVDSGASMHMTSKKKSWVMLTWTPWPKSCSLTIVITANGEVQTHEEAAVYVKEFDFSWQRKSSKTRQQYCRLESFAMKNGYSHEWINGQKPHLIQNGIRIQCDTENFVLIVVPGLSTSSSSGSHHSTSMTPSRQERHCSTSFSSSSPSPPVSEIQTREREYRIDSDIFPVHVSTTVDDRSGRPENQANKNQKLNEKETTMELGDLLYSEIPKWLQEFRENLVDDEIPVHGNSHSSLSHEAFLEPTTKRREDLGKHSVNTHFFQDRNCEICKRTKITRAPCRRRNGEAVLRAANFGDLIAADQKVLSDNCESRNNHRYALVVQDSATQWIKACPCKTKTLQETQRSLQKFVGPDKNPKVIYIDNSLEFSKVCGNFSWNFCTSTPQRLD